VNRPSSGPSRALRRLGALLGLTMAGVVFLALLAVVGLGAAFVGGPILVDLLGR
jgi:hypothetical protein